MLINIAINSAELAESIVNSSSYEEVISLVKDIDLQIGDCTFTEELAKWLMNALKNEYRHEGGAYEVLLEELK